MPCAPFHFGPGLVAKVVAPSYFSFTIFIFSQVLIDLEASYFSYLPRSNSNRCSEFSDRSPSMWTLPGNIQAFL